MNKNLLVIDGKGERADKVLLENKNEIDANESVLITNIDETRESKPISDYLVSNPNQIKSATDNIGTNTLESKYPNATRESLEKFVQQLTGLKNSLDAQGLTVVPRELAV